MVPRSQQWQTPIVYSTPLSFEISETGHRASSFFYRTMILDSSLQPVHPLKNQKLSEGSDISESQDRISNLPDAILCHILSFLLTKYTVRTSALSKRWKYLWISVPNLDFELHPYKHYTGDRNHFLSFKECYKNNFANFLDRLLVLRDNLCIQRFRLSCSAKIDFSHYYSWVCAVVTCNVNELDLELNGRELGELPWSIFTCKSLVVLKIHGEFVFNVPYYVCLPNLKTLYLNSLIFLDDASIQKFLSGCPALEDLEISRPYWDNMLTLNVSVPSLKRLTLDLSIHEEELYRLDLSVHEEELYGETSFEYKIMVNAPNLEYLKLYDHMSDNILVNDMPSLVEAYVSIRKSTKEEEGDWTKEVEYGDRAYGLLRSISNVTRLTLTGYAFKSLSYSHANLPTFHNLVCLELGFDSSNGPVLLPDLLESSPKLEVLVFPEGFTVPWEREYDVNRDIYFEYRWMPPQRVPECVLLSLKTIEIHRFCGDEEEEEVNLVKYLLKNAMLLEKMTILCDYAPWADNSFKFRDELTNYPKGSTNCEFKVYIPTVISSN